MYQNLLYYKFVEIPHPKEFKEEHKEFCKKLELLGKVLISSEGINGCLSGSKENTQTYIAFMNNHPLFSDMKFKIGNCANHTFNKLVVKTRPEIITLKKDVNMNYRGEYIEPNQLKELLDKGEDVVLLDTRNDYESEIGTFAGAIAPPIRLFSELPQALKDMEDLKDKQIVTFCTGGIRCEKATAYMKEQGFENVKQLQGGIIRYAQECGDAHWDGKCFVFDERFAVDMANVAAIHCSLEDSATDDPVYFKKALASRAKAPYWPDE